MFLIITPVPFTFASVCNIKALPPPEKKPEGEALGSRIFTL